MVSSVDSSTSVVRGQDELNTGNDKANSLGELSSEDFVELMITQLQNQDPTEPMDTNEMMSQMAEFSTATGITELQGTAESLVGSLQSSQALQASSLIGRSVLVQSDQGALNEGENLRGSVDLPQSTNDLRIGIYDERGIKVSELDLGAQQAGQVEFEWNGKNDDGERMAPGVYTLAASADLDGEVQALNSSVYANVESVSLNGGGGEPTLNLQEIGSVNFSRVEKVS